MARWTDTTSYANLPAPADADLLPIADVSAAEGSRQRTITWGQLTALAAAGATVDTVDPDSDDDETAGYAVGSLWYNETDGGLFACTDATASAAVWEEISGGISTVTAADVDSESSTDGHVLTSDGAGGAAWEAVPASSGGTVTNHIINGALRIWQRGTSFPILSSVATKTADRFVVGMEGTQRYTVSRSTNVPNENTLYSYRAEVTTANASLLALDDMHVRYALEGYDFAPFAEQSGTLSFDVRSNVTGTYCVAFIRLDAAVAEVETYIAEYTINAANTWERKTITVDFAGASSSAWNLDHRTALKIRWNQGTGTHYHGVTGWQAGNLMATSSQTNLSATVGNYMELANIQLEEGATANDFVAAPIADDVMRCQRYYEKSYSLDTAPGTNTVVGRFMTITLANSVNNGSAWQIGANPTFATQKRIAPEISLWAQEGVSGSWLVGGTNRASVGVAISTGGFNIANNTGGAVTPTAGYAYGHWAADAEI